MTGARVICKVSMMASPVADSSGYHVISAHDHRVSVMAATAVSRVGYHSINSRAWIRHGPKYSAWLWGGCPALLSAMQRLKVKN